MTRKNLWALEAIAEAGYKYSSSIYPIRHDLYGIPEAPRFAFRPFDASPFLEIPVTSFRLAGMNLPAGGGGYFRLLPYWWSAFQLRKIRDANAGPCMFYFHPWEIDPDQPRISGTSLKTRLRHYTNLGAMQAQAAENPGRILLVPHRRGLSMLTVPGKKMKVLFLSHRLPYPPNKGDKIRSHALFTHLAAKHRVFLGCFVDDPADFRYADTVREMAGGACKLISLTKSRKLLSAAQALANGTSITAEAYRSSEMQQWVDDILQREAIDCAVVFSSSMAPYLMSGKYLPPERVLFDMVDLDSDKWLQYSGLAGLASAWIYRREARKLLELERQAAAQFAMTYLVSDHEVQSFAQLAPESSDRIRSFSNGVNLNYFAPGPYVSPFPAGVTPIVMTGHMDYWPNVEGALWFAREVLPLVKRQIPDARFYVVGAQPAPGLRNIAAADVEVTGEVADIRPYVAAAGVVVAPLRIARGVQNKVLEALAMGVPTVATEQASRALGVSSGRDIWVANDAASFADAVIHAAGAAGREAVAANGRSYVERHHDWSQLFVDLRCGAAASQRKQGAAGKGTGMSANTVAGNDIKPLPAAALDAWKAHLAALSAVILALGVLFFADINAAVQVWWNYPAYSHCFLIIPISAWLIWERRALLLADTPACKPGGAGAALPFAALWLIGGFGSVTEFRQFALVGMAEVFCIAILGWHIFRKISFALLYLLFLVPTGQYLIPPLQEITAKFVEVGLSAFSIPFFRDGLIFELVNGRYEIAEACAGLRFLVATVALGALFAHLMYRRPLKIAVFLAACCIVPVIGNGIRALLTVMVANYSNNEIAVGFDHIVYGWVFAVTIIFIILYVGSRFRDPEADMPPPSGTSSAAPVSPCCWRRRWARLRYSPSARPRPGLPIASQAPQARPRWRRW